MATTKLVWTRMKKKTRLGKTLADQVIAMCLTHTTHVQGPGVVVMPLVVVVVVVVTD